jgi:sugar/nucleoside kinase (ribokinase family)
MREGCDAIVAGHICLDIIPALTGGGFQFAPGRLLEVGPAVMGTGGPVSNTGLALHRLGIKTRLMGKVGTDDFGQAIKRIIARQEPALIDGMIEVPDEVSSYSVILSPPDSDRMFLHCPGCNDTFGADDIDYSLLAGARLFHFGYPPLLKRVIENDGAELIDIFRRAKATGVTTSLDMSMPDPESFSGRVNWRSILGSTLPYVDIYLPSLEETLFAQYPSEFRNLTSKPGGMTGATRPEFLGAISADLLSMGPSVVGLKLGQSGFYMKTAAEGSFARFGRAVPVEISPWTRRELWSPCFRANVVGTTGAGDATIAGFLAALLRGCPPEDCATMACAVGGCNVEAADALGGLLSWEETKSRLHSGWPRRELEIELQGWSRCERTGIWRSPGDRPAGIKS